MKTLDICNPFGAPVYFMETVSSTMDVSKTLACDGSLHGTVITADFQEAGRGRGQDRIWETERGLNLPFTIHLRYPCIEDIPQALTLRAGLSVSLAIESFFPSLKDTIQVKWPNDILIRDKKAVGILCEANGGSAHIGIGVNVMQKVFPDNLRRKATSILLEAGEEELNQRIAKIRNEKPGTRNLNIKFILLEKILASLFNELSDKKNNDWKDRLEKRLYMIGNRITFIEGGADSGREVSGVLHGIGENGELLIMPNGSHEPKPFITGELKFIN